MVIQIVLKFVIWVNKKIMTNTELKFLRSLSQQKYRKEYNAYIVEGDKNAKEWIIYPDLVQKVFATEQWCNDNAPILEKIKDKIVISSGIDIERASALRTPTQVIVLARILAIQKIQIDKQAWTLMLDSVRDPGNMGTIIRIADWFGIRHIICSKDCVEIYNSKTVQSSMGSLLRVSVHETDLITFLKQNSEIPCYATCLNGENVNSIKDYSPGIIMMGNESHGLKKELMQLAQRKISIPRFGGAESLNVAVATGIICSRLIN